MKIAGPTLNAIAERALPLVDEVAHDAAGVLTSSMHRGSSAVSAARDGARELRIGVFTSMSVHNDGTTHFLHDALAKRGVDALWLDADRMAYSGATLMHNGAPVGQLDAVIPRYVSRDVFPLMDAMEANGIPLVNNTTAINTTWSKINSQIAYEAHGAPAIPTRVARTADDAAHSLSGLPHDVVVKPYDGEGGNGVEFFTNHADAHAHIQSHFAGSDIPLLVQPRVQGAMVRWTTPDGIATSSAMDYRVLLSRNALDEPYPVAILQRVGAPGSGKSNIDAGGWGRLVQLEDAPQGLLDAAVQGYAPIPGSFGMGGVDIMPVGRSIDQPLEHHAARSFVITETNSSPGIPDARGIDFAGAVAERAMILARRARAAAGS